MENTIFHDIITKAKQEGIISDDDEKILLNADLDSENYFKLLETARNEDVIDEAEEIMLTMLKTDVLSRVVDSNNEGLVKSEELALLKILTKVLSNIK
jgi:hypothetical protein